MTRGQTHEWSIWLPFSVGSLFANAVCYTYCHYCAKMSVFGVTPLVLLLLTLKSALCSPQGVRSSEFDVDDIYEAEVFTPGTNPHEENKYDFENGHSSENFDEFSELGELPDYSGMGKFVTAFLFQFLLSAISPYYFLACRRSQIKIAERIHNN
jgi:hypothetical protein